MTAIQSCRSPAPRSSGPVVAVMRDCLGGERVVEIDLSQSLTRAAVERLAAQTEGAVLLLMDDLPRPFVRMDVPGAYLLTGVLGAERVRFTMRLAVVASAEETVLAVAQQLAAGR